MGEVGLVERAMVKQKKMGTRKKNPELNEGGTRRCYSWQGGERERSSGAEVGECRFKEKKR